MSEKKFDKYYVDSNNVNRMKNILQFVNNCEFNNLKKALSSQTKSSLMFSSLLKKYFNGEFKSSDLLTLKYFIDNYNLSVASYLFSPEVEGDESTKKPAFPLEKVFLIRLNTIGKVYNVINNKVTINGTEYTVTAGKINISGKEYSVINNKVTIDYEIENTSTEYSCFYNRYENLRQHLLDLINIGKPDTPFIQITLKISIGNTAIEVNDNGRKYSISRYFSINGANYYYRYNASEGKYYLTDNLTNYSISAGIVNIGGTRYRFEGSGNSLSKLILTTDSKIYYNIIVSASIGDTSYSVRYNNAIGKETDEIIIENIYAIPNNVANGDTVTINGQTGTVVNNGITIGGVNYPILKKKTLDYLPDILYSIKHVNETVYDTTKNIDDFDEYLKNVLLDNVFKNAEDVPNTPITNFLTNFLKIGDMINSSYEPTTDDTVLSDAILILLLATLYYIISFILKQFIFSKSTIPSDTDKYYPLDAENFNVLLKIPVTPINVLFAIAENAGRKRFSDGSGILGLLIELVFNTSDIVDIGGNYLKVTVSGEDFFLKYFTINSDKVIINNVEYTYSTEKLTDSDGNEYSTEKLTDSDENEYPINNGSVIINNIIYTVEVIINNVRYKYSPEKLIGSDGNEYPITSDTVTIDSEPYSVDIDDVKIISSKKYNIVNNKVTINNIEYIIDGDTLKGNNSEFPIVSNSVTIIDERLSYLILYKELNNYFRDASKTSIYESLVGILLLESKIYNKNVDLGVLLKNNTLYNSIMEINILSIMEEIKVLDAENYKYSLIFDMYFDKPAYRNSYKYFKSNHIYNNLAGDLDILGFISGDYAFSRGFGNGILLETSEDSIDLFIGEYDRCKDYFMTVLHNYAYSSEPGYRAYAFLKILSSAISAWNDNFLKNIYNTDFYTNSDIDSFLRTFGLENIAKNYLGLTDTLVKLKIIENYTKLMREKGTAEIITDLENLLSTETRTVSLKPVFISKYNDGISIDPSDGTKFKIEKDDSLIFVPALNGYNNLFNRIESYIDMGARPFNQVVDDDPYWDLNDISLSFLLKNFDLNMTPTKYLQYNIYVNSDFLKIIAQLLLSGADANITKYTKDSPFESYVRWSKEVAAIYEFITAIYISRCQKLISETYKFPLSLTNTSNSYDKQGYYSWYNNDHTYLGFPITSGTDGGAIDVSGILNAIKSSITINLNNEAYVNDPNYVSYINLVSDYGSYDNNDLSQYIKLIKDITTLLSNIRGMLNSGILLADGSSALNLIAKEENIYSTITTREYPITSLYAGGNHTTLRLISDNIIAENTISNSIINSVKNYIDIDLETLDENSLELIINTVAGLASDKFNDVILGLDNLYTQVVMSIRSVFKEINLTSNYVDSINMILEPMSFSESRDYYQVFTDILKNFLSYSILLIGNAASSSDSKNYTDEYLISESYAILINTFVLLDKIPDIDEELIIYDESGEARVNVS